MKTIPERLAVIRATLSLLYHSNPRAFTISAIASLPEPLFFPTVIFLLQKLFERLTGPDGTVQISSHVILLSLALLATLLVQRLGIIVRDASSTILRQQAWVTISKQVMQNYRPPRIHCLRTTHSKLATVWSFVKRRTAPLR